MTPIKRPVSQGKLHSSQAPQAASGRATAIAFAQEGASVVAADIAAEGVREIARLVEETGSSAHAVTCDVRKAADVKASVDKAAPRLVASTWPSTMQEWSSRMV